jgi:hypothetical protein
VDKVLSEEFSTGGEWAIVKGRNRPTPYSLENTPRKSAEDFTDGEHGQRYGEERDEDHADHDGERGEKGLLTSEPVHGPTTCTESE